jgi:hypothetical protein
MVGRRILFLAFRGNNPPASATQHNYLCLLYAGVLTYDCQLHLKIHVAEPYIQEYLQDVLGAPWTMIPCLNTGVPLAT